jgi:hypothetical protein
MCTLTFVPKEGGYYAGMNRDELRTREVALPPELRRVGNLLAMYPSESNGGTWIGANGLGITLALLNWHPEGMPKIHKRQSRGMIIPGLLGSPDPARVCSRLEGLRLAGTLPFRLIGIFPREQEVLEWRWDGRALKQEPEEWEVQHWFSSGISDAEAKAQRSAICDDARAFPDCGSLPWLRQLHRSHGTVPGPFSLCVHRPDAATVSFCEISCGPDRLSFGYLDGNPCGKSRIDRAADLPLVVPSSADSRPLVFC